MKKIILLAAFIMMTGSVLAQNPQGTKIVYDADCPPTVTANSTTSQGSASTPATITKNDSRGYDARTTVTDNRGNQSSYSTPAQTTTLQRGGDHQNSRAGFTSTPENNSNVSKIEVECAPVE